MSMETWTVTGQPDPDFTSALQRYADDDHARQSVCSWCGKAGIPYEYHGIRYDGLTAASGDRLCKGCLDSYTENMPLLVRECMNEDDPGRLYDLNPNTWDWSEENIPGCFGQPPVRVIAIQYRAEFTDLHARRPPKKA